MKPTDFSKYLTDFFGTYLPIECGVSQNTILTYSYTFSLLIEFLKEQEFINPQRVTLADITKERIINFLQKTGIALFPREMHVLQPFGLFIVTCNIEM